MRDRHWDRERYAYKERVMEKKPKRVRERHWDRERYTYREGDGEKAKEGER